VNSLLQLKAFVRVGEDSYLEAVCEGTMLVVRNEGLNLYTGAEAISILQHYKLPDERVVSDHIVFDHWGERYSVIAIHSRGDSLPDRVVFRPLDREFPKRGLRMWLRALLHDWLS